MIWRRWGECGCDAAPHAANDRARLALQEWHRRRDGEDVSEVVALEVAPEEEEREQRERVAGEHRRKRGVTPQAPQPPDRDRRRDRELDHGEREVRLAIVDDAELEQ